jgi:Leucine-rich repeat (LRR) protein
MTTCVVAEAIDTKTIEIKANDNVNFTELLFDCNENLKFLPMGMGQNFPELLSLSVFDCSLESVDRSNFIGLTELQRLALNENYLTVIEPRTFKDLASLKWLYLDHNHLKVIHPDAFESLTQLEEVTFRKNPCIQQNYNGKEGMEEMIEAIKGNCVDPNEVPSNHA